MALSPHEERVFASLEAALRADDPALAAVFGTPPPPALLVPRIPRRHVVHLVVALLALVVVTTLWRTELGAAGITATTAVLVLPWLFMTAHATAHRRPVSAQPSSNPFAQPPGPLETTLVLGCGVLLAAMTVPTVWVPVVVLVATLVLVPWLALRVMTWIDRETPRRAPTHD